MRAAVLREVGKPVSIEEVLLEDPRRGELRLRIAASGICRSDLYMERMSDRVMPELR